VGTALGGVTVGRSPGALHAAAIVVTTRSVPIEPRT